MPEVFVRLVLVKYRMKPITNTWYDIPGMPGYQINTDGDVKGKRGSVLKTSYSSVNSIHDGVQVKRPQYKLVCMYVNHKQYTGYIHRLLALTFIPRINPDQNAVNHKNYNKTDNRLENLEWCTYAENMEHSNARDPIQCPHCLKIVKVNANTHRYHFDRCKKKPS